MKAKSIIDAVEGVTSKWAKQRKREERDASAYYNRRAAMVRRSKWSIRDAAFKVMEVAYMKASANDTLPANARQIMYAARPDIQRLTGEPLNDGYFTQRLLPDYVEETDVDWDVVYDARGHFSEPHGGRSIGLGTLEVRSYLAGVDGHEVPGLEFKVPDAGPGYPTCGPQHRFGALLFIEKEGFLPLFEAVNLTERFDIAIMSTKGMSVTACRQLADNLCGTHDIPLLVLHDFDKSGFSIAGTLQQDTRRYFFENKIEVIDLGLRLADIAGLEAEGVPHQGSAESVAANLRQNGATPSEVEFLLNRRVELNAMPSDVFVAFIERKLKAAGVKKVVPDQATLEAALQRARLLQVINVKIEELRATAEAEVANMKPIVGLNDLVCAELKANPALSWDDAVAMICKKVQS